jgi:hemerythrin-like domain-containing protein
MLSELHQEHINIAKLLDLLRQQLFAIRSEKAVRYRLLKNILCYLSEVSDQCHHPQEDLIYDYYLKYRCDDDQITQRLKNEHELVVTSGKELTELVDMILMDAVIPLDQLTAKLEAFIVLQQRHMDFEEGEVFPELRAKLTEDDWRHLEQNWRYKMADDPLFGREVAERYQDLSDSLGL